MSRYSEVKNRIQKKINGQEGATLLLALLFFLLCAVCGSVILASATSSSGRIAGLGRNRQKYQSAEAAARLLENELNHASVALQETEKITVTVEHVEKDNDGEGESGEKSEETYTTTTYTFSGPDFLNVGSANAGTESSGIGTDDGLNAAGSSDRTGENDTAVAAAFSADNGRNTGLSMLEQLLTDADLSSYTEKGEVYQNAGSIVISDKENETSDDAEDNLTACQQAWAAAFLTGDAGKSIKRHFALQLSDIEPENSSIEADSPVEAELQLYGDGTLEIRLSSGGSSDADSENTDKGSADADRYYMLLRGTAEVKTQSRSERSDSRTADGDDAASGEGSETLITKKTTITWGDFVITKNAAEAGAQKEAENGTKAQRQDESSEEET